ncbi:MAG: glutamate--tRNA ligase, partial [Gammaproteobacteria bacterium]|nr:glutamate--tRNA ligase [Gammaproteobacteria bacterium]
MTDSPHITRFAPSPTGRMHLGNARTALFNALLGSRSGGQLILRIEDTDAERSTREHEGALLEDLAWLGIQWSAGPDIGGPHGPYRQSERSDLYAEHYARLESQGQAYPCFCSPESLKLVRKAQLAAGQPPRYPGTCATLSETEIKERLGKGMEPTLRFRVPLGQEVRFTDLVYGEQVFKTDDIGDFIIRRANGTPAFFFSNAIDDSLMGVTLAMRGVDHLANTPRQLLLLDALGMRAPAYAHFALVQDSDGGGLSKRLGSLGLAELREQGYLPLALANYLARLGHSYAEEGFKNIEQLSAEIDEQRFGRAPARFDPVQLEHWQVEAVHHLADGEMLDWLLAHESHSELAARVPAEDHARFVQTVRDNIVMPVDAAEL